MSPRHGVFLGLIASAGIAYGGWRAMEEEGTSFGDQADRIQDPGPRRRSGSPSAAAAAAAAAGGSAPRHRAPPQGPAA